MPPRLVEGRQGSGEGAADRWGIWSAGAEVDTTRPRLEGPPYACATPFSTPTVGSCITPRASLKTPLAGNTFCVLGGPRSKCLIRRPIHVACEAREWACIAHVATKEGV
ncbi:hypothetical protein BU14_0258s0005 [Porphyra umbilicalis]|uniref:Uncharacterized protein n=1 Tax=Porphyra umbilicalis TaxID=2786 RepID=A0A1X6P2M2_PORUM|nr:hypothetical protein BU14_0258s0005 [Porphyra umbilicalis]|eukprot:OSX75000.1 hypothetical protein BU14_0258s0005 [Porphyra umbilicalis]